jgi:AraC-like DNA-binding protein/ligand-binding sensor protein
MSSIEPLLSKAQQVLSLYDRSMDIPAGVLNKAGQAVKTPDHEEKMRFCALCRTCFNNPQKSWQGEIYPCTDVHFAACAESRQTDKTYIYSCPLGFAYWTSPFYRNRCYAGSLLAGQVLMCKRDEAVEKFRIRCYDSRAAAEFKKMLEYTQIKNYGEIQAMARLLGVCAENISEKAENPCSTARYLACEHPKSKKQPLIALAKKSIILRDETAAKNLPGNPFGNPIEKERALLAAFQRGDNETGRKIIRELLDNIQDSNAFSPASFEIIRIRAMELAVLLSRAAMLPEAKNNNAVLEANNRYLKRIQESKTREELTESLYFTAEHMAGKIFSFQGIRHSSVLRKAHRYIWENFSRKISLDEISKAAGLSAPYFSSVFKEEMGENLSIYLNRLRVEKAANLLIETRNSLNVIAELCGFEDQSWFSKIFKKYIGVSPGQYRKTGNPALEFRQAKKHIKGERKWSIKRQIQYYSMPAL